MPSQELSSILNTDIYLIDQILKGRYDAGGKLLDAGCGGGRNLSWFVQQQNITIYATDINPAAITQLGLTYPTLHPGHLICTPVQALPFEDDYFDHIICSTVLHFADSETDFLKMIAALRRVLKPGGSLFTRTASDIGIEKLVIPLGNGRFSLPDGSDRFLLTRPLIDKWLTEFPLQLLEPVKTTNVHDKRCMTTLVLQKQ